MDEPLPYLFTWLSEVVFCMSS